MMRKVGCVYGQASRRQTTATGFLQGVNFFLVYEVDEETGSRVVVELLARSIPLIEAGQFDNVQSDRKLRHLSRDVWSQTYVK